MATKTEIPPDVARSRYPWIRRQTDAWTELPIRTSVREFLNGFLKAQKWALRWQVIECFAGMPGRPTNINRTPLDAQGKPTRGSSNLPYPATKLQSTSTPILILQVTKNNPRLVFEVSLQFPDGNQTTEQRLAKLYTQAGQSFIAQDRQSREML